MTHEEELAYKAGRALPTVVWGPDATPEQRRLGEHHSPFAADRQPKQHAAWCRGLRDALRERDTDTVQVLADLDALDLGEQASDGDDVAAEVA